MTADNGNGAVDLSPTAPAPVPSKPASPFQPPQTIISQDFYFAAATKLGISIKELGKHLGVTDSTLYQHQKRRSSRTTYVNQTNELVRTGIIKPVLRKGTPSKLPPAPEAVPVREHLVSLHGYTKMVIAVPDQLAPIMRAHLSALGCIIVPNG